MKCLHVREIAVFCADKILLITHVDKFLEFCSRYMSSSQMFVRL